MKTKLLENLKAVNTGERSYIDTPLSSYNVTYDPIDFAYDPIDFATLTPEMGYLYRIDVRLGANQFISDLELQKNPNIINQCKTLVGRGIAEEVYGEVRNDLIKIMIELRQVGLPYNNSSLRKIKELIEKISY